MGDGVRSYATASPDGTASTATTVTSADAQGWLWWGWQYLGFHSVPSVGGTVLLFLDETESLWWERSSM